MPKGEYEVLEALNPFFEVVREGLRGLVDGDHYSTRWIIKFLRHALKSRVHLD